MKKTEKKQETMLSMFNKLSIDSNKSKVKKNKTTDKTIDKLSKILKEASILTEEEELQEVLQFIRKLKSKK